MTRFLSDAPTHWGTVFHYSAPFGPILAMSAADGLARIAQRFPPVGAKRLIAAVAGASVLLSSTLPGRQPLWRLFSPDHYRITEAHRDGYRAIAMVPPAASVVAQAAVVPHLSQRERIFVLDAEAPDADYAIASSSLDPWPAARFEELRILLEQRRRRGYTVALERNGWMILRRVRTAGASDDGRAFDR